MIRRCSRGRDLSHSRTGSLPDAVRKKETKRIGSLPFIGLDLSQARASIPDPTPRECFRGANRDQADTRRAGIAAHGKTIAFGNGHEPAEERPFAEIVFR